MSKQNLASAGDYDFSYPFLLTKGAMRIIQIQPTLRCNLRCAHCYSESGPEQTREISVECLEDFLLEARVLGYNYIGVSGGEPLLWDDLDRFLDCASDLGYSTSVITNGTLLTPPRAAELRGKVGLVAVSVEGPPEDHAAIRGPSAFLAMTKGIAALRAAGVPFTIMFTLTRFNAHRLSWLFEFADEVGATGVEIHPLASVGAARLNLADAVPDSLEFKVAAWLLALVAVLRGQGGPGIIMDVIRRSTVEQSCWPMLSKSEAALSTASFSDLVPSLVVEPDGCIVPFIYSFPRKWALGSIGDGSLESLVTKWRERCMPDVAAIIRATLSRLAEAEYIDLFCEILETARKQPNLSIFERR